MSVDAGSAIGSRIVFEDYLGFHQRGGCLLIQVTLACPLECAHCCVNSSPSRTEKLASDSTTKAIKEFSEFAGSKIVCLTGGEPFSNKAVLRDALDVTQSVGLQSYVITAAHWAKDIERAQLELDALPKIDLLSISVDHFHENFVPVIHAVNALVAAQERGISTNLLYTHDPRKADYLEHVRSVLSENSVETDIHITPLGPPGRGAQQVDDYDKTKVDFVTKNCRLIGSPTVVANGNVSLCCQVNETNLILEKGREHGLYAGHISSNWNDDFSAQMERPIFRAVRSLGPAWIYDRARSLGLVNEQENRQMSTCESCAAFCRSRECVDAIDVALSNERDVSLIEFAEGLIDVNQQFAGG